jgi:hypothetical protein
VRGRIVGLGKASSLGARLGRHRQGHGGSASRGHHRNRARRRVLQSRRSQRRHSSGQPQARLLQRAGRLQGQERQAVRSGRVRPDARLRPLPADDLRLLARIRGGRQRPVPVAGLDGTGAGGHTEVGAEQIDGWISPDCAPYVIDLVSASTPGGDVTLKFWLAK